jgi:hypothetical protein
LAQLHRSRHTVGTRCGDELDAVEVAAGAQRRWGIARALLGGEGNGEQGQREQGYNTSVTLSGATATMTGMAPFPLTAFGVRVTQSA